MFDRENNYHKIPELTLATLERYRDHNIKAGGFLEAVLSNDLSESIARADKDNGEALSIIVTWVFNELPSGSWGSYEKYRDWVNKEKTEEELFDENHPFENREGVDA